MAVYFDGLIACLDKTEAKRLKGRFAAMECNHDLAGSHVVDWHGFWWASFIPIGLGFGVPADLQCHQKFQGEQAIEIVTGLFETLRKEKGYQLAMIGWEIQDRFFDPDVEDRIEIGGIPIPDSMENERGLILHNELCEQKNWTGFEKFASDYQWRSFEDFSHWQ